MNWKKHFVFISTALWLRSYQEVKEPTVSEWFPMKMQDSLMRSLGMWLWRWTSGCTWLSAWTEWTAARSPWWWTPAGPLLSIRQTTTSVGTSSETSNLYQLTNTPTLPSYIPYYQTTTRALMDKGRRAPTTYKTHDIYPTRLSHMLNTIIIWVLICSTFFLLLIMWVYSLVHKYLLSSLSLFPYVIPPLGAPTPMTTQWRCFRMGSAHQVASPSGCSPSLPTPPRFTCTAASTCAWWRATTAQP